MHYILTNHMRVIPEPNPTAWRDWMRTNERRIRSSHVQRRPRTATIREVLGWLARRPVDGHEKLMRALGTCSVETWFEGVDMCDACGVVRQKHWLPRVFATRIVGRKVHRVHAIAADLEHAMIAHNSALEWLKAQICPDPERIPGVMQVGTVMLSQQPIEVRTFGQQSREE